MSRQVEVQYLRPAQILAGCENTSLVFLPTGPLEWHGPHLPLGVDPLLAREAAVGLAQKLGGVVMPTLYLGTERERSPEMLRNLGFADDKYIVGMDFPDNSLKSLYAVEEVFALVVRECLRGLILDWGFRRIAIINGHGGENHLKVLQRLVREFTAKTEASLIMLMPMLDWPNGGSGHASLGETESMMCAYPDTVDLSTLPEPDQPLQNTRWAIVDDRTFQGSPAEDFTVSPEEDPRQADRDHGAVILARTLEQMADIITRKFNLGDRS